MQTVDLKKAFGSSVRTWRNRLGISQEELGGRAGLHRTYVSDIERGARNVSLESMEKLSQALQVSVATLFSDPRGLFPTSPDYTGRNVIDILLVEDSPSDIAVTMEALRASRFVNRIQVATNGEAALETVFGSPHRSQSSPPVLRPHLVLLDLGLPKLDGLEVLRAIKSDERTRSIPVVVLTASTQDRDRIASRQLGADGFIVKPVGITGLTEVTPSLRLQWALLGPDQLDG